MLTIVRVKPVIRKAQKRDEQDGLERLCQSIQIVSRRDIDGTVTIVMRAMLEDAHGGPVGSSELAAKAHLNRVTVIHHLRRLEQAGIVEHSDRKYRLCIDGFEEFVKQVRKETLRMFDETEELAAQIDREYFGDFERRSLRLIEGKQKHRFESR